MNNYPFLLVILLFLFSPQLIAQMSIPFKIENAHVAQFSPPFDTVITDQVDSELSLESIEITKETQYIDGVKKNAQMY